MRPLYHALAFALSSVLAAAAAGDPGADDRSLAERIDLTRITVLQADYARAAHERNAADLATYEREVLAMLQQEVLPHARTPAARVGATVDATLGGTGAGAAGREPPISPAVAVDEEEVGAASLEAKLAELCRELMALQGKTDRASLEKKAFIIGALQGISDRAQYPSPPDGRAGGAGSPGRRAPRCASASGRRHAPPSRKVPHIGAAPLARGVETPRRRRTPEVALHDPDPRRG